MNPSTDTATSPMLDAAARACLDRLTDLLIPASPDGRMPAARSLDLYARFDTLGARDREVFVQGLAHLDSLARARFSDGFAALGAAEAMALVEGLRAEASVFLQTFMTQTVGRYLAHPTVMPLIGLEARPHWPKGHVVAEGDWSLIDVVRRRPKMYRKI